MTRSSRTPTGLVAAQDGPDRLELLVAAGSPVGVELEHLDFTWSRPEPPRLDDRRAPRPGATAWPQRVTYLMEPLVVLEVDAAGGEVELRSQSPTPRGQLRSYYEVQLRKDRDPPPANGSPSTRPPAAARPTTFQLSREVLERLADDLADCARVP